jgi:hypothetical protein
MGTFNGPRTGWTMTSAAFRVESAMRKQSLAMMIPCPGAASRELGSSGVDAGSSMWPSDRDFRAQGMVWSMLKAAELTLQHPGSRQPFFGADPGSTSVNSRSPSTLSALFHVPTAMALSILTRVSRPIFHPVVPAAEHMSAMRQVSPTATARTIQKYYTCSYAMEIDKGTSCHCETIGIPPKH